MSGAPLPIEVSAVRKTVEGLRRDNNFYRVTVPGAKRRRENAGSRF